MPLALGIALAALFLAVLLAQFLIFPAMWSGFRDEHRRFPAEKRRRGAIGGGLALALVATGCALSIVQPWGPRSVVYVILVGAGALMLLVCGVGAVGVAREVHRRHTSS